MGKLNKKDSKEEGKNEETKDEIERTIKAMREHKIPLERLNEIFIES